MTYSIVARDPDTGELGAAIQSKAFCCGVSTLWAEAGVGIVASQSFTDPGYGPLCLLAMKSGASAEDALAGAVARDRMGAFRQVGVVSSAGDAAAHTGEGCIAEAGHVTGAGIACQANMMGSAAVWPAMLQAFGEARGSMAQRLLRALAAAQAEGGDWRGQEAGRVLVVAGQPTGRPWDDVTCDVRVDNHPQPVAELGRLVARQEALAAMRKPDGRSVVEHVQAAADAGLEEQEVALAGLYAARDAGDVDAARPYFERLLAIDQRYVELVCRLPGLAELLGLEPAGPEP